MSTIKNVRLLAIFNFFSDLRFYGPFIVLYFADVSGSFVLGGSVLSARLIATAVLEVPTGVVSDRLGRRRTMITGAAFSALALMTYAVAPGYEILLAGALLDGLARALYSGNNDALLYDSLAQESRQSEFHHHNGHVSSMNQLALASSALMGGLIVLWSTLDIVVWLSVIPQIICVLVAIRMVEPAARGAIEGNAFGHIGRALQKMRRNAALKRMVFASALRSGVGETAYQYQPAFIASLWPTWAVGVARTVNNGLAFVSFRYSGRVIDRFGATKTLFAGEVWANAANLIGVLKPTIASPLIVSSESCSFGTSTVALRTLQQHEFSDSERATMGSLISLLGSLVYAALMTAIGFIADEWGLQAALLVSQAVGVLSLPLIWSVHRGRRDSRGP